ncbi:hypothetical protein [Sphingobium ummariense]
MMLLVLGALAQATPLPPQTWKERNHPDMPSLPACDLSGSAPVIERMADLPPTVATELTRLFAPDIISEADGPFNNTDVIGDNVPTRRFIRAYHVGSDWIVWYELGGGQVAGPRTIALRTRNTRNTITAAHGTTFAGDLCAASKAIVAGVRTASP